MGGVEAKMLDDGALWTREEITLSKVSCSKLATNKVSQAGGSSSASPPLMAGAMLGVRSRGRPLTLVTHEQEAGVAVVMRMMTDDDGSSAVMIVVVL